MVGVDRKDWYVLFLFHFSKICNFPLLFTYCLISKGYHSVSVHLVIPQKQWFFQGCHFWLHTLSQVLSTTQFSGGDCVCTSSNCFVFSCSFSVIEGLPPLFLYPNFQWQEGCRTLLKFFYSVYMYFEGCGVLRHSHIESMSPIWFYLISLLTLCFLGRCLGNSKSGDFHWSLAMFFLSLYPYSIFVPLFNISTLIQYFIYLYIYCICFCHCICFVASYLKSVTNDVE